MFINGTYDAHCTIHAIGSTEQAIKDSLLAVRNPSQGIHTEYVEKDILGDHRVHIIAPDITIFFKVRERITELVKAERVERIQRKQREAEFEKHWRCA